MHLRMSSACRTTKASGFVSAVMDVASCSSKVSSALQLIARNQHGVAHLKDYVDSADSLEDGYPPPSGKQPQDRHVEVTRHVLDISRSHVGT